MTYICDTSGNCSAHIRIPQVTTTPPLKAGLEDEASSIHSELNPWEAMFDWEKYSFTSQWKARIELATYEIS